MHKPVNFLSKCTDPPIKWFCNSVTPLHWAPLCETEFPKSGSKCKTRIEWRCQCYGTSRTALGFWGTEKSEIISASFALYFGARSFSEYRGGKSSIPDQRSRNRGGRHSRIRSSILMDGPFFARPHSRKLRRWFVLHSLSALKICPEFVSFRHSVDNFLKQILKFFIHSTGD